MGLLSNQPRPDESGSSNDGNTTRRFFENTALSSHITGVSEELTTKFTRILRAISNGYSINVEVFNEYALYIAEIYLNLYSWFYMPPSIHKILIQREKVVESAILPIGMISEEMQQARNKHIQKFRESCPNVFPKINYSGRV